MSRSRPRRLFLHPSALSDAEYSVYVDALHDVLDEPGLKNIPTGGSGLPDEDLEARMIGVREARAWMRGRYRDVKVSEIDNVRISAESRPACPRKAYTQILHAVSYPCTYMRLPYEHASNGRSCKC